MTISAQHIFADEDFNPWAIWSSGQRSKMVDHEGHGVLRYPERQFTQVGRRLNDLEETRLDVKSFPALNLTDRQHIDMRR
jgi:hypothetical protein